jgi:MYXO-CTERM domain-containing protein
MAGRGGSMAPPSKPGTGGTTASAPMVGPTTDKNAPKKSGGCNVANAQGSDALALLLLAAVPLLRRRRR